MRRPPTELPAEAVLRLTARRPPAVYSRLLQERIVFLNGPVRCSSRSRWRAPLSRRAGAAVSRRERTHADAPPARRSRTPSRRSRSRSSSSSRPSRRRPSRSTSTRPAAASRPAWPSTTRCVPSPPLCAACCGVSRGERTRADLPREARADAVRALPGAHDRRRPGELDGVAHSRRRCVGRFTCRFLVPQSERS